MPIGPVLPGRLPNSLRFSQLSDQLSDANRLLASLQQQAATGQRIFRPGEDPAAAVRAVFLQASIEHTTQLRDNVDRADAMLTATDLALTTVGDGLVRAKAIALEGIGDNASPTQRAALADELAQIISGITNAANQKFNDRYLFGGGNTDVAPFETALGRVVYHGDDEQYNAYVDSAYQLALNLDGHTAFTALNEPASRDVNPALTLNTPLADLHGGIGVPLGTIRVTADDGTNPAQTVDVDLATARTIGDVKTRIENAFAGGPPTVTVDVDPATNHGIRIQQSGGGAGTVTVVDLQGSLVASKLGIAGTGVTVNGSDLDPRLSIHTNLADLNGGTGIGTTTGNGLQIVSGTNTVTLDISSATTVEDLFNLVEAAGLDLETGIDDTGTSLVVASRRSGESFSIGENNGSNATLLGIRTLHSATTLAELNFGVGVPNQETDSGGNLLPAPVTITRRDGTTSTVDLQGLTTVQQVVDAITAVDANLTATLNAVGNGISITDASGTGPLTVESGPVADALGISGTQTGTGSLVGSDVNRQESGGLFDVLVKLEAALRANDLAETNRLTGKLDDVVQDFTAVRGLIGSRLKLLDDFEGRLLDRDVFLQERLSDEIDADITEVVTRVTSVQTALQATLQIAASTQQLSILNFL